MRNRYAVTHRPKKNLFTCLPTHPTQPVSRARRQEKETLKTMTPEDVAGTFLYGLYQLHFDDLGLQFDRCGPADLNAVGTAAVLAYRVADRSETPAHLALSRLAVKTGALLVAPRGPDGTRILGEWLDARSEYLALQLRANC